MHINVCYYWIYGNISDLFIYFYQCVTIKDMLGKYKSIIELFVSDHIV